MRQLHSPHKTKLNRFAPTGLLAGLALLLGCEKNQDTIIDSVGSAPRVTSALLAPSSVNTDTMNVGSNPQPGDVITLRIQASAKVIHSGGAAAISAVRIVVFDPGNRQATASGTLNDDGVSPDVAKGDSI